MREQVVLWTPPNSELIGLVQALAALERQELPAHALIGGVAVMTRLAQAHRVTLDLDQVLRETVPSTVDMLVATTPALFAAKLQAAQRRPQATLTKRGTDIDDARRLLETVGTAKVAHGIADAPGDLAALVARLVDHLMIQDAERSVLWIKQAGAPGANAVAAEDLRDLGKRLHSQLTG